MSLYVGRISPHVRPDELERVFRRFGRCSLRLKDGYGFVVYEFNADAEKALRTLRGRNICGEHITLNWSNRQPPPFQRSARPTKIYEPYHRRNFREENNGEHIRGSQDRRDFSAGTSHGAAYDRGGHRFDEVIDKEAGHGREDIDNIGEERGVNSKGAIEEGVTNEPNPVENDRWGQPVSDPVTGQEIVNGREFDRYEPYQGYNRRDEKENNQRTGSHGSCDQWNSQEKGKREYSIDDSDKKLDKSKVQQICYKCGLGGHIMRNCPEGDSKREKFSKFSHRREEIKFRDRGDGRLKMLRTNSWGKPKPIRDPLMLGRDRRVRKGSHFDKVRREARWGESIPERRDKRHSNLREESEAKKKSKRGHGTKKKALKKRRARRFDMSSLSSDSSSSQTHSRSSRSTSRTSSHSGSKLASSSSRSGSVSSYSKSHASRSRSRSRSRSSIRSASVSIDEKSPSSLKHVHPNVSMITSRKDALDNVTSSDSKHDLDDMQSSELKDENALVSFKTDNETNGELQGYSGGDAHNSENCTKKSNLQGTLSVKSNMHTPEGSETCNSASITTQEMLSALKHYGLAVPEEGEADISVERYFGAARLWPWEMICYRRLKKGPISTENYARRLEQNKEFGIVDKYIRSSSGWGEREQHDE